MESVDTCAFVHVLDYVCSVSLCVFVSISVLYMKEFNGLAEILIT